MTQVHWYLKADGTEMTKEELIVDNVEHMAAMYIENNNGLKPTKNQLQSWIDRLRFAYDQGLISYEQ